MKRFLPILLLPALSVSAFAQGYQAEAVISKPDGQNFRAWITAATKTEIRYKTTAVSTDFVDAKLLDFATVHLMEPPEFAAAVDLYEGRKYKEAQEKFAAIKAISKPLSALKDNYYTLSGFYELECMRRLGDYEGIQKALKDFIKEPLTRDYQLRQLDLYVMCDQRTQVAFCKGAALENLGRGAEALIEYGIVVTADSGASEEITEQAALNALGVYFKDEAVQTAIRNWGTEDENKNSPGYSRLLEAAGLADLYQKYLTIGKPLSADLKGFLKYLPATVK
jgi:tetratricopeptide (TPR) repeat protein